MEPSLRLPTIAPLLWQHGEPHEVLRDEIRAMHGAGIRAFIVESRPHPDYLGPRWWSDMDAVVGEAKSLGMQAWFFDDATYPTGFAAGAARDSAPHARKRFLRREVIEAIGPRAGTTFRVGAWCAPGEAVLAVVAGRLADEEGRIDGPSLEDLTARVRDGRLAWDVPSGRWRVFVIVVTPTGGEEWTKDHVNPIDPAAVRVLIDTVYEAHFRRYGAEFGRTVAGFFSDEPRFGNVGSYDARIGHFPMVLPWRDGLMAELSAARGAAFAAELPALWEAAGEGTARARVTYMDVVSRLYGAAFSRQIGDWCRAHGVRYIGHVVEDNGGHARLGYGAGHFFRALSGQDASGFDMVYQVWPGHDRGRYLTPFGDLDARFFYWGIAKLASSAAHVDPLKQGATACELFGAYGWRLGLRMMKWLTDHACVRGANLLIPHAFSPKDFPDPDCPPHFRARGHNPQWRFFGEWVRYADRVCGLLSGGDHVAAAAVLYHAEAEWAGSGEPFESVVEELARSQVDCDVVPADALVGARAGGAAAATVEPGGLLVVNRERYPLLVVPRSELLPSAVLCRIAELAGSGVHVAFMSAMPRAPVEGDTPGERALESLRRSRRVQVVAAGSLVGRAREWGVHELEIRPEQPHLRVYHYRRADGVGDPGGDQAGGGGKRRRDLWFLVNEALDRPVEAALLLRGRVERVAGWDALGDLAVDVEQRATRGGLEVEVRLEPFASLFLLGEGAVPGEAAAAGRGEAARRSRSRALPPAAFLDEHQVAGPWTVSTATASEYPHFSPAPALRGPRNVSTPGLLPMFAGTLRYTTTLDVGPLSGCRAWLDLGEAFETAEAWLNGERLGARICPPYRFALGESLHPGANQVAIEVTTTLAPALGDNGLDRAMPQDPAGLLGPVRLLVERDG